MEPVTVRHQYAQVWAQLSRALATQAPDIQALAYRPGVNYRNFRGPRHPSAPTVYSCNYSTDGLRVEAYFDNDARRHGIDAIAPIEQHLDVLQDTFGGPERLRPETRPTARGETVQRLAVYRPGTVADEGNWAEHVGWFIDRLVRLQRTVATLDSLDGPAAASDTATAELATAWPLREPDSAPFAETGGDVRLIELTGVCAALAREPLLHASLGSKELFHSNILGWLVETFPDAARHVFQPMLTADPGQHVHRARRELKSLDLVIELPGFRPLVIENKVFSLPDETQLDRYAATNMPAAKIDEPDLALLSLADPNWSGGRYGNWRYLSYLELAARLLEVIDPIRGADAFSGDLLEHYANFITALSEVAELVLPDSDDEPLELGAEMLAPLRTVRLHDAAQKLRARHVMHVLAADYADAGLRPQLVESNLTNGRVLLTTGFRSAADDEFGWQLQGGQWRRYAVLPQLAGRGPQAKTARAANAGTHHHAWFTFTTEQQILGHDTPPGPPSGGYNHYDPDFVYRYVKADHVPIRTLRELATSVATEADRYARGQPASLSAASE
jgi:hypothetical protein